LDPNYSGYAWIFRDFGRVDMPLALSESQSSEIILSHPEWQLKPDQPYRGMALVASRQITWDTLTPMDLVKGVFTHTLTTNPNMAIFWIREDLFTGANP
jgi:hypothetical protein